MPTPTLPRTCCRPCQPRSLASLVVSALFIFFFSSRRRHTRLQGDWSSDVCSSDLRTILVGQNVTFAVGATGTSPTYQWRFNGADISGATLASYSLANVQTSNAGNYSVVVTNILNSVTSRSEERRVGEECRSRWSPY